MTNYKCIVTLKSGAHKVIRMTRDVMAKLVAGFRMSQTAPWLTKRYEMMFNSMELLPYQIAALLFINEFTGERLEIA